MFDRLVHADWSTAARGRWFAEACRGDAGWLVRPPRPVGPTDRFVDDLLQGSRSTLAGFDFPIGLPASFGGRTGFNGFRDAIRHLGTGDWRRFHEVAEAPADISLHRPFYPRVSSSLVRQEHLLAGLGVEGMHRLMRECERATADRPSASSLFWTLGAKQVGKAAIAGWREIVRPALDAGALLWPFDGDLPSLARGDGLVICETYPAEACRHVGIRLPARGSKTKRTDRLDATAALASRCGDHGIRLDPDMAEALADGFGGDRNGQDRFDAVAGLLGMIEVADGRRRAMPTGTEAPGWEGWILGQSGWEPTAPIPRRSRRGPADTVTR